MNKPLIYLVLAASIALSSLHASVIHSTPPNQSGGSDANTSLVADQFSVSGNQTITQLKFWALQTVAGDYTGSIAWSLAPDSTGTPGANVASGLATPSSVSTGLTAFSFSEFSYTFAVNVNLTTGLYWLILHNGPNASQPATDFFWEYNNGASGNSQSFDIAGPGPWVGNSSTLAFEVSANPTPPSGVPEPATLLLCGAGLAVAVLGRRRLA